MGVLGMLMMAASLGGSAGCGSSAAGGGGGGGTGTASSDEANGATSAALTSAFNALGASGSGALTVDGSVSSSDLVAHVKETIAVTASNNSCTAGSVPTVTGSFFSQTVTGATLFDDTSATGDATVKADSSSNGFNLTVDFNQLSGTVNDSNNTPVAIVLDGLLGFGFISTSSGGTLDIGSSNLTVAINGGSPLAFNINLSVDESVSGNTITVTTSGCVALGSSAFSISGTQSFTN